MQLDADTHAHAHAHTHTHKRQQNIFIPNSGAVSISQKY